MANGEKRKELIHDGGSHPGYWKVWTICGQAKCYDPLSQHLKTFKVQLIVHKQHRHCPNASWYFWHYDSVTLSALSSMPVVFALFLQGYCNCPWHTSADRFSSRGSFCLVMAKMVRFTFLHHRLQWGSFIELYEHMWTSSTKLVHACPSLPAIGTKVLALS